MRLTSLLSTLSLGLILGGIACSSEPGDPGPSEESTGGSSSSAGGSGSGGLSSGGAASGGASAIGGSNLPSGGAPLSSGGALASGGALTTGGAAPQASGGAMASGGDTAAGGAPSGGSDGSGGGVGLGPAKIWLAGDSTVANGNTPCPVGWGKMFASLFDERITVVNSAVGGRSVRTWLYDVKDTMDPSGECVLGQTNGQLTIQDRWKNMLAEMKEGDFLLIQFGINDGDRTCPRHVGVDAFRESYRMMAEAARERGTTPVFITPVSAIKCNGSTAIATRGFLDAVQAEGAALGVAVIDLHQRSIDLYNKLGFCPAAAGGVSASTGGPVGAFFCDDHTHFDTPGAIEIGKLVAEGLRDEGVALAEYLR